MFMYLKVLAAGVVAWLVVTPFLRKNEPETMEEYDWFGLPKDAIDAKESGKKLTMSVASKSAVDALIAKAKTTSTKGGSADPMMSFFMELEKLASEASICEVEIISVKNGSYMGKSGPYAYGRVTKIDSPDVNGNSPAVGDWVAIFIS